MATTATITARGWSPGARQLPAPVLTAAGGRDLVRKTDSQAHPRPAALEDTFFQDFGWVLSV